MKCCVDNCKNPARNAVTFAVTGTTYNYCDWHTYRRGELRWRDRDVMAVRRLTAR